MSDSKRPELLTLVLLDLDRGFWLLILIALVLASAFGLIYSTHMTRQLTANSEKLLQERDALTTEWRNLRLEMSSLIDHSRVEAIAQERLDMTKVESQAEVVIKR